MSVFIYLDTETSGREAGKHGVLCIGVIVERDGEVILRQEIPVQSENKLVSKEALAVNGIHLDSHNKAALPRVMAAREIIGILKEHTGATLVGHKISFDIDFLMDLCTPGIWRMLNIYRCIDTLGVARFLQGVDILKTKGMGLEALAKHFEILGEHESQQHNALADAELTRQVFYKLRELVLPDREPVLLPGGRS